MTQRARRQHPGVSPSSGGLPVPQPVSSGLADERVGLFPLPLNPVDKPHPNVNNRAS
jgi:hypothetical protein